METREEFVTIVSAASLLIREAILTRFKVESCIETTRLGLQVFNNVGIPARPQPVKVAISNDIAHELMKGRVPTQYWPPQAHSIGCGYDSEAAGDGWNGHLVLVLKDPEGNRHIADISADQFDRPGKIDVRGPVGVGFTPGRLWTPLDPATRVLDSGLVYFEWAPFAPQDPIGNLWKEAPAWSREDDWFDQATTAIIKRLEKSSETPNVVVQ
jgi:hypothetical protein